MTGIDKRWWKRWREVIGRVSALAASMGSLLALALPHVPTVDRLPWWGILLAVVAFLSFVTAVVLEVRSVGPRRVYAMSDSDGIRGYMHDWIEKGGRVAIWTRDMSWASEPETKTLLREKAGKGELIICLPEHVEITKELEEAGADVWAYGDDEYSPSSRFTVTFFDRDGARVAVGRAVKGDHVIDEFDSNEHPAFYIAQDLVRLARRAGNDA